MAKSGEGPKCAVCNTKIATVTSPPLQKGGLANTISASLQSDENRRIKWNKDERINLRAVCLVRAIVDGDSCRWRLLWMMGFTGVEQCL